MSGATFGSADCVRSGEHPSIFWGSRPLYKKSAFHGDIAMTGASCTRMISRMRLPSTLAWLSDAAGTVPGADRFLAVLPDVVAGLRA